MSSPRNVGSGPPAPERSSGGSGGASRAGRSSRGHNVQYPCEGPESTEAKAEAIFSRSKPAYGSTEAGGLVGRVFSQKKGFGSSKLGRLFQGKMGLKSPEATSCRQYLNTQMQALKELGLPKKELKCAINSLLVRYGYELLGDYSEAILKETVEKKTGMEAKVARSLLDERRVGLERIKGYLGFNETSETLKERPFMEKELQNAYKQIDRAKKAKELSNNLSDNPPQNKGEIEQYIATLKGAKNPRYASVINKLETQLAGANHSLLMQLTDNQGTKESMYCLRITDIKGFLEALKPHPQYAQTVDTLKECLSEKVALLSKVDQVLWSYFAEGGVFHSRMVDSYSLDKCRAVVDLLNHESLPEHQEMFQALTNKIEKYEAYMDRLGQEPKRSKIFSTLSVPEIKDFQDLLESEYDGKLIRDLKFCQRNKIREFDKLSSVLYRHVSPEHPGISAQEARSFNKRNCIEVLNILQGNRIPECSRVNIPILEARLAEIEQQEAREAREAGGSEVVEYLHRELRSLNYASMGYAAKANCLRGILIEWNLVPEAKQGTLKEATNLKGARTLARKIVLFTHPDKNETIDKDLGKALIELATAITNPNK